MELELSLSFASISLARLGSNVMPRSQDLASLLESSDIEIFGVGELVRWLSKPPNQLAMQTHEPKVKVAPRGGVMVLKAKVAIELADELAKSPT